MASEIPLCDLVVSTNSDKKPKSGDYISGHKLSQVIATHPWSPIAFRDNYRKGTNFLFSDWAVLDYDDGMTTVAQAIEQFCDCIHIIGTTKRHQESHPRFRVCIPWSHRIEDLDTFKFNQKKIIKENDTDAQCIDGARFYYPCREIVSINPTGFRMDVLQPTETQKKTEHRHKSEKSGFSSAVTFFMKNVMEEGKRNFQIYQVAKDLFRIGLLRRTIKDIVLSSPTYRYKKISDELSAEIDQTIESAWRSINDEN